MMEEPQPLPAVWQVWRNRKSGQLVELTGAEPGAMFGSMILAWRGLDGTPGGGPTDLWLSAWWKSFELVAESEEYL